MCLKQISSVAINCHLLRLDNLALALKVVVIIIVTSLKEAVLLCK